MARLDCTRFNTCVTHHDDVIKWKRFPRYWPFVRGIHRSPVNSPHKGLWRGALIFYLICTRINGWVNNGHAGDLRRHWPHYDVTVMITLNRRYNHHYVSYGMGQPGINKDKDLTADVTPYEYPVKFKLWNRRTENDVKLVSEYLTILICFVTGHVLLQGCQPCKLLSITNCLDVIFLERQNMKAKWEQKIWSRG